MANEGPPTVPSDEELRERATNALKRTDLFRHVGRRVLGDLVDKFGLTPVGRPGERVVLENVEPAVLVVLEGALEVQGGKHPVVLQPGVYLRSHPLLLEVHWDGSRIEAVGATPVRVFLLNAQAFDGLPRIVVNALDPNELEKVKASFAEFAEFAEE